MRVLNVILASALLLATVVDAKMGFGLWGCPKRNTVSVPYDPSMNITVEHRVIYLDNFLNWLVNSARLFTPIPDISCANVLSFRYSENSYTKVVLNETTNPFNAKLVYYDAPTGTKAYYGCFDAKVISKMLDYLTSQGFIGENWYYKALASSILLGNYIEGAVVLSTTKTISDTMKSAI